MPKDLSTKFMGLELRNPLIAGSSGLTSNLPDILTLEDNEASAIVLKSLFEEQIIFNYNAKLREVDLGIQYPEANEYISRYAKEKAVEEYILLVQDCKKRISIPVIASINCITPYEWTSFATEIERAGADGIELNMFFIPADPQRMSAVIEESYLQILHEVIRKVSIPVSVKISPYFSGLSNSLLRFSFTGVKAMVLFNRFFAPDIDIERLLVIPGPAYSNPEEINLPLRWIAMLSDRIYCDLAASTGVHDGEGLVKVLLAGARAAEIASVLYIKGPGEIKNMLKFLEEYLDRHSFGSVSEIIGKMSIRQVENPSDFERVQFLKYYSGIE